MENEVQHKSQRIIQSLWTTIKKLQWWSLYKFEIYKYNKHE